MSEQKISKYRQLCEILVAAIRNGEYAEGSRLPGERDLAARYGMSHMTARRAVTELVESEILDRRLGSGIYVRPQSRERLSSFTLHIVCSALDSSTSRQFILSSMRAAEEVGWEVSVTRLLRAHEHSIARAIEAGEPALMMMAESQQRLLLEAMRHPKSHVVSVGNRLDDHGIPSVLADDTHAMRLMVEHLRFHGHRRIALVSGYPESSVERVQIAVWRDLMQSELSEEEIDADFIALESTMLDCSIRRAHEQLAALWRDEQLHATALICLADDIALGVLSACRAANKRVPEDISLITSGDSPHLEFAIPPISVIDVDLEQHARQAIRLLRKSMEANLPPSDFLRLIEPRLVQRESVAAPPTLSTQKARKNK